MYAHSLNSWKTAPLMYSPGFCSFMQSINPGSRLGIFLAWLIMHMLNSTKRVESPLVAFELHDSDNISRDDMSDIGRSLCAICQQKFKWWRCARQKLPLSHSTSNYDTCIFKSGSFGSLSRCWAHEHWDQLQHPFNDNVKWTCKVWWILWSRK